MQKDELRRVDEPSYRLVVVYFLDELIQFLEL